ncbi:hypothetical protein [Pseudomonas protegens]|uniref:hypothetical protein n=1 Tax=Pseudomonas protegens TaxID=380021 RepID=UPI00382EE5F0
MSIAFDLTGGQVNGCTLASSLIARVAGAGALVANKGYDSEAIRKPVKQQGAKAW